MTSRSGGRRSARGVVAAQRQRLGDRGSSWPRLAAVADARRSAGSAAVAAARHELGAARMERAARRPVVRVRDRAADRRQPRAPRRVDARDRAQQRPRVGVLRRVEDVVDRPLLDHAPQVHDDHVVGHLGDDAQVVGDEHDRHAAARACSSRSRSRICACVVTSSAVVGSSAISSRGSQDSAIAIIARCRRPPLSWKAYSSTRRSGRGMPTSRSISIARSRASRLLDVLVQPDRLDDLVADGVHRAERGHRLLEDERDLAAADRPHLRARRRRAWRGRRLRRRRSAPQQDLTRSRSAPAARRSAGSTAR